MRSRAVSASLLFVLANILGVGTVSSGLRPAGPSHVMSAHPRARSSPKVQPVSSDSSSVNTPNWACIRNHESQDSYTQPGGGAYQFERTTFYQMTGLTVPAEDTPPSVQNAAALKLYAYDEKVWGDPWHAWSTRFVCGLG